MKEEKQYSLFEDQLNAITHLVGAGMGITALIFLVYEASLTGRADFVIGSAIFCLSAIFLYSMSGVYHLLPKGETRSFFRILDHSAIYVLISGTYTPFLILIGGTPAMIMLAVQWILTFIGILFKIKYTGRFGKVSVFIYLFMGWMIVFIGKSMVEAFDAMSLWFLIAGGVTYSLGVIFYAMTKVKYTHAIWHLFVIGGTLFHYMSIFHALGEVV